MSDYDECRCYVDHLAAEHRRLHRTLRQMRAAIAGSVEPDVSPTFAEVARILGRLRDELELHFTEEEAGGCLDEAISRCPRLASEVKRIEGEHPAILAEVDRLIDQVTHSTPTVLNQIDIQHAFERLYQRLIAHEKAENQVLAQGLGISVNGDENGRPTLILDT